MSISTRRHSPENHQFHGARTQGHTPQPWQAQLLLQIQFRAPVQGQLAAPQLQPISIRRIFLLLFLKEENDSD